MKQTTIVFCVQGDRVLLGMKKRGFGAGKWNGFGGKVEAGESFSLAAARELAQESGLGTMVADLDLAAQIQFFFADTPMFDCSVYITRNWTGEPVETDEMRPRWFPIDNLPFTEMWPADVRWVPVVLAGDTIEATVTFDVKGKKVVSFESKTVVF